MNRIMHVPLLASALGMWGVFALPSQADEVTFIDGGYHDLCADAASELERTGKIEITGSRLGIEPLEVCNRAIRSATGSNTQLAASYNNRGVIRFEMGDREGARQDFERAVAGSEALAQAWLNLGYTLIALQRFADSIPALDRGIALGGDEAAKAYYNRGIAHEETGAVRAAYDDYRQAAALAPDWEDPRRELARFRVLGD